MFLAVVYSCFNSSELEIASFLPREDILFLKALISGVYQGFDRVLLQVRSILAFTAFVIASVRAKA